MKKSVKAALLSALVYPGVGHFSLKKYAQGAVFSCAFSVPLYFLFSEIMSKAEHIAEQIQNGEIPLDIIAITEALSSSVMGVGAQELNIKMYALVFIWFVGIIDSYRLGRTST